MSRVEQITIEQVISAGKAIVEPALHMEWILNLKGIIFVLVVVSMVTFYIYRESVYSIKKCLSKSIIPAILAYFLWGFFQGVYIYNQSLNDFKEQVTSWKQEVASPYIDQLAWTSKDVLTIDPNPDVPLNILTGDVVMTTQSDRLNEWTDTDYASLKLIAVTYADGPLTKQYDYFEIKRDLKSGEKMILKTKVVPKDLGFDLIKGNYNSVLHVPSDYNIE